jgi:LPXTG-site transpeptidase (sortase) family protein
MKRVAIQPVLNGLLVVIMVLGFLSPAQQTVSAATTMRVEPVTWNVIGLDSNNTSAGPNIFPVGVRVCNLTGTTITGVTPTFFWGTGLVPDNTNAAFIYLRSGSYGNGTVFPAFDLQPSGSAGSCKDVYYEVEINRLQVGGVFAYNKTRKYTILFSGTQGINTVTGSSPTPREIFVERLVSQNRNYIKSVRYQDIATAIPYVSVPAGGSMDLKVGKTYNIELVGATATQGYEQIEAYINFDNTIFSVNSVTTTYSANAGTDSLAGTKLYADGCSWVNDPNNPLYRSCTSTGKYGGIVTTIYNITILKTGNTQTLMSLVYDFSGSSYHYNADYVTSARFATITAPPDPNSVTISKGFVPSTITSGGTTQLVITINNPNTSSVSEVAVSDDLPSGMTVNSPLISSLTGCGTGSLSGTGGNTINFSGGTIAATSSCTIKVNVTATSSQTNTTNALFVDGVNTTKTASAVITIASTLSPCVNAVPIAKWSIPGITPPPDDGAGVPSTLYTGVTATAAGNDLTSEAIQTATISPFSSTNWWTSRGFNVATPGSINNGFAFTLTSASKTFSYLTLTFNTGRPNANAAGNFSIFASNAPTTVLASGTIALNGQSHSVTIPGSFPSGTTFYIAPYGAPNNGVNSTLYLDEVAFSGDVCSTPPPTISKSFGTDPILVNDTSILNFSIANTQTGNVGLTGVAFTDLLPVGLTVSTGAATGTCTAGSSGTVTTTSPNSISLSSGVLAAGGNCTFAVTVTGAAAGEYENISGYVSSTQTGTSTSGANVGYAYDTITVIANPVILKSFDGSSIYNEAPDNTVNLNITITNPNPSIILTGLEFTDNLPSGIVATTPTTIPNACGSGSSLIVASGSISLTGGQVPAGSSCTLTINVSGASAGLKTNTVQVSSTNGGTSNTSTAQIEVKARTAALEVNKQTSLTDTGPWSKYVSVTLPGSVWYKFTVYNTGDTGLTNVQVRESGTGVMECNIGDIPFEGEGTCVLGPVTAASGDIDNTVYATADGDAVSSYPQTSMAKYATSEITLLKTAAESSFATTGDVLNYLYKVSNTGFAPLLGPVTVSDDKAIVTCPAVTTAETAPATLGDGDEWLDKGEYVTCTATYTITEADITAGSVTNTATATIDSISSTTDTVTVNKQMGTLVINKVTLPAGDATSFDFTSTVTGLGDFNLTGLTPNDTTGELSLDQGIYTVTESAETGWVLTDIACSLIGTNGSAVTIGSNDIFDDGETAISVDLRAGDTISCTFTNSRLPILSVVKTLTNDNGGSLNISDFSFIVDGGSPVAFESDGQNDLFLQTGIHNVTEESVPGYLSTYSNCALIDLAYGETAVCTITNNDIAPKLTVIKHVVNDNGGTLNAGDFSMTVTGTEVSLASFAGVESPGTEVTLDAGAYSVGETEITGYSATYSSDCSGSISIGESKTCTITNNDVEATLNVVKVVNNNHGGTLTFEDFSFQVNGASAVSFESDGQNDLNLSAGTYTISEPAVDGYSTTYDNCSDVILAAGGSATCTITNSDIAPTITLEKTVVNDNFGALVEADFPAFIGSTAVSWDIPAIVDQAGTYTVSETQQPGYIATGWGGDCATDGSITLAIGDNKTCTITNDDHNPVIHLEKTGKLEITVVVPATMVDAGDEIDYDFAVTNLGNVVLSNVTITDSTPACDAAPVYVSGDANANDLLDLTETWHFGCTHTLTQEEIDSGSYANTATATGTSPVNGNVNDDDTNDLSFTLVDELTLTKTSDTTSVTAAEQVVPYTITLVNGGNTTLSNLIVTDAMCDSAPVYQSGDVNEDEKMQPTEDWIYICSYIVTQADIDNGTDISNTAFADATEIDPAAEDTLDIPVVQGPAIELTKTGSLDMSVVDPDTLTNPGDTITYTFSVKNTGNVTLWNDIAIEDPLLPSLSCVVPLSDNTKFPTGFAPGDTAACVASDNIYTLTVDDIDAGDVINTATASTTFGGNPVIAEDQATTETLPVRGIALGKTADVTTFSNAGQIITYTYTITNTGNLDLYPVYTVVDDKVAVVNCPILPDTLVPGGSVVCTAAYIVSNDDLTAGSIVNHATAFVNTKAECAGGCVLAQAEGQATVNFTSPQPEDGSANDNIAVLPATGFAPNVFTALSGQTGTYSATELVISIPSLNVKTKIIGVPKNNGSYAIDWLWNEAGWLQGSAYPGSIGNSVITGHVYLPNGRPGPFVDLKTLSWGQKIIIEQNGKAYIYEVRSVMRVKPDAVEVMSHKDYGYLTLITCQGYDAQTEEYLFRTVIQAVLVDIK